jgi:hypothetical protein
MPRDESITVPLQVRLLLHIAALSLQAKAQERKIEALNTRLARLEAAHEK